MPTDVLLTGAYGRVGTAIVDNLAVKDRYDFTLLDQIDPPTQDRVDTEKHDVVQADVSNLEEIRPIFEGQDAVYHLAGYPETDGTWPEILENNIIGMYNALEAAKEGGVETFIFASTNHVVGMYEIDNAPDIYYPDFDLMIDHNTPRRPDSYYGVSKSFGEDLGRYYVENFEYPKQFYALRLASVRHAEYDHPYGDAEHGVDNGDWERGSKEYDEMVARMKAMWQSRRDHAHMVEQCINDEDVEFDIFYGVSDNDRRWFDIQHAKERINYRSRDNGEEWEKPPG